MLPEHPPVDVLVLGKEATASTAIPASPVFAHTVVSVSVHNVRKKNCNPINILGFLTERAKK